MARQYLDDAHGPDGVRVTIAIEPGGARLERNGDRLGVRVRVPRWMRWLRPHVLGPFAARRTWVVDVEADSGWRVRLRRPERHEAVYLAKSLWHEVNEGGLPALEAAVSAAG
ncbi:hypothetical protein [Pimelobacter sp. 30-1]|uniref:hypothetical protein n=1 Tax=Pimelobacter sp. 30-1 TaxID=2004991 RepID=UPI001C059421|nr:hypothetical protein [Pimelobacter sp. 30-1]MBU2693722.1 hypothetical protein [Pimelobacter sp. 30-1]